MIGVFLCVSVSYCKVQCSISHNCSYIGASLAKGNTVSNLASTDFKRSRIALSTTLWLFPLLSLINADFCVAGCLIAYGAVLGKVSPVQLMVLTLFGITLFAVEEYIILSVIHVSWNNTFLFWYRSSIYILTPIKWDRTCHVIADDESCDTQMGTWFCFGFVLSFMPPCSC